MALFVLKTAPSLARIPCPFLDIYHKGIYKAPYSSLSTENDFL
jgi:hypothetical protein